MSSTHSFSTMIIAASAPAVSSSSDPFWQQVVLSFAPGVPMIVVVFGVLFFASNSLKSELGAKMDAQTSNFGAKLDMQNAKLDVQNAKLEAKMDTLIATISGRLDNHEDKVKNQLDAFKNIMEKYPEVKK